MITDENKLFQIFILHQVRTSTRELPPSCHTYGALVTKDLEGAGAGESIWPVTSQGQGQLSPGIYISETGDSDDFGCSEHAVASASAAMLLLIGHLG